MKYPKILGALFLVLTVVLSACSSQATPTNPPLSTEPPLSTSTSEVMGTASPETTGSPAVDLTGTPSVSTTGTAGVPNTGADCSTVTVQTASAADSSMGTGTGTTTTSTGTPSTGTGGTSGTSVPSGTTTGKTEAGDFLVDCNGMALYVYSEDTANSGSSTCTGDCATEWMPLTVTDGETPMAGTGVDDSLLSTITRDDGTTQVTYNGWPLYLYSGDSLPGDQNGLGMGTDWSLISPSGDPIQSQ